MIAGYFLFIIFAILLLTFIVSLFSSLLSFLLNIVLLIAFGLVIYTELKKKTMYRYYLWGILLTAGMFIGRETLALMPVFDLFARMGLLQISTAVFLIYVFSQVARFFDELQAGKYGKKRK